MIIVFNMLRAPIHLKLHVFKSHTTELNHVGRSLKAAVFGLLSCIIYAFPILGSLSVGIKSESIIAFLVSLSILGSSLECAENFFMTSGGACDPYPSGSAREVGDDMMSCTCTGNLVNDELSPTTTTTICSSM